MMRGDVVTVTQPEPCTSSKLKRGNNAPMKPKSKIPSQTQPQDTDVSSSRRSRTLQVHFVLHLAASVH
jgi:hypothetical protein